MKRLRIEVPATSANLGPGFDTLGLALDIVNTVRVELTPESDVVRLDSVSGDTSHRLDPVDNLLCAAYRRWGEDAGAVLPGARFSVENRIPIGRGLGASAAAIVAGLSAAASAAGDTSPRERLVRLAGTMEGHADNAVAAVLGGVTAGFIDGEFVRALNVASHLGLGVGLFVPDDVLLTADARNALPRTVPLADAVFDVGRTAYLTTALMWGRWEEIGPAMRDRLHQPYRARLLPALDDVIAAAITAGAYGAALSGGGPSVIALGPLERTERFAAAMHECAAERGWQGRSMVTGVRHLGVQVVEEKDR